MYGYWERAKERRVAMLRNLLSLQVFMVELTRGWNSRLGFSLQPEGNHTVISVVHRDSVAAKDGRLKQGDVLLMVNLVHQVFFQDILWIKSTQHILSKGCPEKKTS